MPTPATDSESTAAAKPRWSWPARIRPFCRDHKRALLIGGTLLVLLPLFWGSIDLNALHHWAEAVNPAILFGAIVLLPLVTFPVTPLNIIAGIRFGLAGGLAFVAGAIVCQHLLAFFTARALPTFLCRKLDPWRNRLPRNAHVDATIFTALLPGAPYWAQLYVLPLVGVPLTTYLLISATLHTIRSLTAIIAGEISDHPSTIWVLALAIYGILLAVACLLAGRRMARKYKTAA